MTNYRYLDLPTRRTIEALYLAGGEPKQIATYVGVSLSTIYRELQRGATGEIDKNLRPGYSAELAEKRLRENFKRRGRN